MIPYLCKVTSRETNASRGINNLLTAQFTTAWCFGNDKIYGKATLVGKVEGENKLPRLNCKWFLGSWSHIFVRHQAPLRLVDFPAIWSYLLAFWSSTFITSQSDPSIEESYITATKYQILASNLDLIPSNCTSKWNVACRRLPISYLYCPQ